MASHTSLLSRISKCIDKRYEYNLAGKSILNCHPRKRPGIGLLNGTQFQRGFSQKSATFRGLVITYSIPEIISELHLRKGERKEGMKEGRREGREGRKERVYLAIRQYTIII